MVVETNYYRLEVGWMPVEKPSFQISVLTVLYQNMRRHVVGEFRVPFPG